MLAVDRGPSPVASVAGGADHVVDYTTEDFATSERKYDVVLHVAGNRSLRDHRRALTPDGTLVLFFTMLDEASPLARFFGLIDVFVVWWLVVLAVGMSVLYRKRTVRMAALLVGAYAVVALALAGVMAALGGTQ